ncbi:acyloxyacyl hydrolase [Polaribacter sp. M15]
MIKQFILVLFLLSSFLAFNQNKKDSQLTPFKIGFLYNFATNENFLNDDSDYDYTTNTFKLQAFYKLTKWKGLNIELMVQPQVQFLKHQLLNRWYVTPDQDNFQDKIDEFTKSKKMNLYGVDFGFAFKKQLVKKLDIQGTISLGLNYIDTRTERLAKGFTFNENFSLGFSYQILSKSYLYLGSNLFGHVSNLDFKQPNDGYNILGFEIGWSFLL